MYRITILAKLEFIEYMRYLYCLILLFSLNLTWAQPANDDCSGVIDLGVAPVCPEDVYTNENATPTDVGNDNEPGCFINNPPSNDVWFQFVTDAVIIDYTVTLTSTNDGVNDPIDNVQFAIYRGFCADDNLFLNDCVTGAVGEVDISLDLINLTPNELYYIRVDNYGDNNAEGDFKLCIEEKSPDVNIDEEFSDDCTGTLYDSGGPDGNYGDNEEFTFTICPEEFHQCLVFNMEYFNIEGGFSGDNIQFFNGPDANSPFITEINGGGFDDGGGGVCFTVQADSCMTIVFTSGDVVNFEGFKGNWECLLAPCTSDEPFSLTDGATKEQIENAISTTLANVTVDTIICDDGAYAIVENAEDSGLGIEKGLLLTCGAAVNAIGPNNNTGASTGLFTPGDDDLDILSDLYDNGQLSNDACIIEVDVQVFTEELTFEYIFGSEEYPEFLGAFNDIFALLIEGPGIVPIPELGTKDNMAIIPDTDLPVSVNTINHLTNWEYYRNNKDGQTVQYDGLTSGFLGNKKTLTASATVQPCSTYHLKFAIADRTDTALDSGVFISEIKSGTPEITAKFSSGLDYFVEKCVGTSGDTINLILSEAVDTEEIYTVVIGGTAIDPDDYSLDMPDTIVFAPGQIEFNFPIVIFDDDIDEGEETLIISLFRNFGCGDIEVVQTEIFIRENIKVEIEAGLDSLIVCAGMGVQVEAEGANNYIWTPFDVMSDPFISNPIVESGYTGWVYVEGKIDPFTSPECIGFDSIFINSIDPTVEITTMDSLNFCFGDTITLVAETNAPDGNITWTYDFGTVESPNDLVTDVIPPFGFEGFPQTITVTIELGGCIATDQIEINVDPFTIITPLFEDTIICQNSTVELNQFDFSFNNTTFNWTPETFLDDPTTAFTTSTPDGDIDYELIVTSPSGFCADTFNYSIEVLPNEITITNGDSVRICLGDSINLSAAFLPLDADVTWTPDEFITENSGGETIAFPNVTTDYTVTVDNSVCSAQDVIRVYVDSLPDMPITAIPVRDPYCKGEVVTFVSPGYKGYEFPMIEHDWVPGTGVQNETSDYNLVIGAEETTTYIRTTTNGACSEMDTISINVVDPTLEIGLQDTSICAGDGVQLSIIANGELEEIEWDSDSGTFSCDDCPEPFLDDINSSSTVTVTGEIEGCPISASMQVGVIEYNGDVSVIPDTTCNFYGDELTLTANIFPEPPGGIFTIAWAEDQVVIEGEVTNPIIVNLPGDDGSTKGETTINYAWTVTDQRGCTGSGGVDICVKNRFDIPSAFSPGNADGLNDVFRLIDFGKGLEGLTEVEIADFSVFNRWGQKVFECDDFECATITGWDGNFNDVRQPGGTYVYYVKIQYLDGNTQSFKGDLLLIR